MKTEHYNKLVDMFKMQNELQTLLVGEKWAEAGNNYNLAIAVEMAELIDHYGYKWWKKQNRDMVQCQLEVVDIFHFYMSGKISEGIRAGGKLEGVITNEVERFGASQMFIVSGDSSVLEDLQYLLGRAANDSFYPADILRLMHLIELDIDTMYRIYVSKNALNIFRYKNGYKEGTYVKTWHGEEDNIHLDKIMKRLDGEGNLTAGALLDELSEVYASV